MGVGRIGFDLLFARTDLRPKRLPYSFLGMRSVFVHPRCFGRENLSIPMAVVKGVEKESHKLGT